ncbi:hypothetical protein HDU98_011927 [Podochytrium sp. JEL0797]|nr:hypothetical protein HDU98_011927 [Podochytrium sp. JEL0797]
MLYTAAVLALAAFACGHVQAILFLDPNPSLSPAPIATAPAHASVLYTRLYIAQQGAPYALKADVTVASLLDGCISSLNYDNFPGGALTFESTGNTTDCGSADLYSRMGRYFTENWSPVFSVSDGVFTVTERFLNPERKRQDVAPWVFTWIAGAPPTTSTTTAPPSTTTTAITTTANTPVGSDTPVGSNAPVGSNIPVATSVVPTNSAGLPVTASAPTTAASAVATSTATAAGAVATSTATAAAGVASTGYVAVTQYVAPSKPTDYAAPGAPGANAGNNPFYAAPAAANTYAPAGPGNLKASGAESMVAMGAAALVAALMF